MNDGSHEAAWRPLFDGSSTEAWRGYKSDSLPSGWQVIDGALTRVAGAGDIVTREQFQDFELELEFMIDEHGKYNSGVYLRNDTGTAGRTGYQVNIGRGAAEEYCAGIFTDRWLDQGDEDDSVRKKLDWNKLRILARGGHIEVELNGVKVSDYTDPAPPAKFLQKGVIGLQTYGAEGHDGWVLFRNLRVREIE